MPSHDAIEHMSEDGFDRNPENPREYFLTLDLLQKLQSGNWQDFESRTTPRLLAYLFARGVTDVNDRDEILQETYLSFFRSICSLPADGRDLYPLLKSIANRRRIDKYRTAMRNKRVPKDKLVSMQSSLISANSKTPQEMQISCERVEEILREFTPKQRRIITHLYLSESEDVDQPVFQHFGYGKEESFERMLRHINLKLRTLLAPERRENAQE